MPTRRLRKGVGASFIPIARCNALSLLICQVRDCMLKDERIGFPVHVDGTPWSARTGESAAGPVPNVHASGTRSRSKECYFQRRRNASAPRSQAFLNTSSVVAALRRVCVVVTTRLTALACVRDGPLVVCARNVPPTTLTNELEHLAAPTSPT